MSYPDYTAESIREKVQSGEIKAQQVLESYLGQIDKHEEQVKAFLQVFHERARAQAEKVDRKRERGEKLGRLAGVPVAIKDNILIKNELTTCASKFLSNYRAVFDATVIRLMEEEDAVFIGKTNLDEFAMGSSTEHSCVKRTANPWNLKCVPGGSSGGSAAAVAARMAPLSLGSDTGGSIRQPAALCGIVGLKPSYGRVSRYGLVAFGSSLDQIGPFANNVRDIGVAMEVLGQHCRRDSTSMPRPADDYFTAIEKSTEGMTVGIPTEFISDLSGDSKRLFDEAVEKLKSLGMNVVEVDLSLSKYSVAIYYILATAEASTNLARFDGIRYGKRSQEAETLDQVYDLSREDGFGAEVKRRILLGTYVLSAGFQSAYYRKAQKVRTLVKQQFASAFKQCDVIAMPTTPEACFEIGAIRDPLQMYLSDIYTISSNLAGVPGISMPCGFTDENKPLGIQFIGPQFEEVKICQVARAYEKATKYTEAVPELVH